eukprot:2822547-Rhodomonas_salina.1
MESEVQVHNNMADIAKVVELLMGVEGSASAQFQGVEGFDIALAFRDLFVRESLSSLRLGELWWRDTRVRAREKIVV